MRDFKFRVWLIPPQKMISDEDRETNGWFPSGGHHPDYYEDKFGISQRITNENIVWMQYTGVKDKNGKEIYEGDIVITTQIDFDKAGYVQEVTGDEPKVKDIVTMNRFPVFWLEHEKFGHEGELLQDPSECEVIGNIHEKWELL